MTAAALPAAQFYNDRVYQLDNDDYKADDLHHALDLTMEWEGRIPKAVSEDLPAKKKQTTREISWKQERARVVCH